MRWLVSLLILFAGGASAEAPPLPPTSNACKPFVEWELNLGRMDGTPMTYDEIQKITIYVMETPEPRDEAFVMIIDITDPYLTSWRINKLNYTVLYFSVRVVDLEGRESAFSVVQMAECDKN